jgi:hypothetical protein
MAAPGALAISKTIFPETKKTRANWDAIRNLPKRFVDYLIRLSFIKTELSTL